MGPFEGHGSGLILQTSPYILVRLRNGENFPCTPVQGRTVRTTVRTMSQLPAVYEAYLQGKDEDFIATVRPVLQQSVAEKNHGVRIIRTPHVLQAHTDPAIPFGEIVEVTD